MSMTIRDYLKRRLLAVPAIGVVIALVAGVIWYLGFIGILLDWWPRMLILMGTFFVVDVLNAFAIRCPNCNYRFAGDVHTAIYTTWKSIRVNFCPGCGTSLESRWRDPNRL